MEPGIVKPGRARLGEVPRRPVLAWVVLLLSFAGGGFLYASMLGAYWVAVYYFGAATQLTLMVPTEFGSPWRILLAVAITALGLLPAVSAVISGYYAFAGYRWARVAAIISFVLSGLGLLLNVIAFPAIALTLAAAVLAWLPPLNKYYAAWRLLRHPKPEPAPAAEPVYYGPLPKYLPLPQPVPAISAPEAHLVLTAPPAPAPFVHSDQDVRAAVPARHEMQETERSISRVAASDAQSVREPKPASSPFTSVATGTVPYGTQNVQETVLVRDDSPVPNDPTTKERA